MRAFRCSRLHPADDEPRAHSALDEAESLLGTRFPDSYRLFVVMHGSPFVPDLWEVVVRRELAGHPLREFLTLDELVADNRTCWSGGMPADHVGIAGDFMGNLFGFPRVASGESRPDDLPVRLFDHDYCRVVPVAESFDGWLNWFVDNVVPRP
ncbi:MAG: SMI1/KNR4 family protein [Gemmataceae bacterium]|nr:SMI1/KNR4 family protein [Gemmataceae bacterium]